MALRLDDWEKGLGGIVLVLLEILQDGHVYTQTVVALAVHPYNTTILPRTPR